jgi:hypothetical protein
LFIDPTNQETSLVEEQLAKAAQLSHLAKDHANWRCGAAGRHV